MYSAVLIGHAQSEN